MIQIKKASQLDSNEVMNIRMEMLKVVNQVTGDIEFDDEFIEATRKYFQEAYQTTVLALEDNKAVGCATICYVSLMPTFDHPTGKRAHIMNVYTREGYRKQGIAIKMMNVLVAEAKQKGVTELSLDTTELGRPFYEACGFVATEEGMVLNLNRGDLYENSLRY